MAETIQVAFRLPVQLVGRLDSYAELLTSQTPGAKFTRSDAARVLLLRALDDLDTNPSPKTTTRATKKKSRRRA